MNTLFKHINLIIVVRNTKVRLSIIDFNGSPKCSRFHLQRKIKNVLGA